jgi:hypothetical protein
MLLETGERVERVERALAGTAADVAAGAAAGDDAGWLRGLAAEAGRSFIHRLNIREPGEVFLLTEGVPSSMLGLFSASRVERVE